MKKNIILFTIVFLNYLLFATDDTYFKIKAAKTTIGNDYFKGTQKKITGVSGEQNEIKIRYYRKEHTVELSDYSIKKY